MKKNIVVLFGGKSVEHDISILTGLHASRNIVTMNKVHLVYMTKDNKFMYGKALEDIRFYIEEKPCRGIKECFFTEGFLYKKGFGNKKICKVDVVLNCAHGGIGENGELAASLNVIDIPVTSCNYISAGKLMSKSLTREILGNAGFIQPKFRKVAGGKYKTQNERDEILKELMELVKFPMIVKPDVLGSSIGIAVVRNEQELQNALDVGFDLGDECIVEEFIENALEVNCAAFYAKNKVWLSNCEILDKSEKDILDYEKKYIDGGEFIGKSKTGLNNFGKKDDEPEEYRKLFVEIRELTEKAYILFGASGVVRFDFLVDKSSDLPKIYLNEANTVPGFLSYHLWMRKGIPYGALIEMICDQAIENHKSKSKIITEYKSDILAKNRSLVE